MSDDFSPPRVGDVRARLAEIIRVLDTPGEAADAILREWPHLAAGPATEPRTDDDRLNRNDNPFASVAAGPAEPVALVKLAAELVQMNDPRECLNPSLTMLASWTKAKELLASLDAAPSRPVPSEEVRLLRAVEKYARLLLEECSDLRAPNEYLDAPLRELRAFDAVAAAGGTDG